MDDTKDFKSWDSSVREQAKSLGLCSEKAQAFIKEQVSNPDPIEFLDYCEKECVRVVQANRRTLMMPEEHERYEMVEELLNTILSCRACVNDNNLTGTAKEFLRLGRQAEAITRFTRKEMSEFVKHARVNRSRHSGFRKQNSLKALAKRHVAGIAMEMWRGDTDKEMRLKDTCDKVWDKVISEPDKKFRELLPDVADGLRSWLRPVAQQHAPWVNKGGRPPNSRK